MSTLGIVALTSFVVLFATVMIAFSVYLAWAGIHLRRLLTNTSTSLPLLITQISDTLKAQSSALESQIATLDGQKLIEAARAQLAAIKRNEALCIAFSDTIKTLVSEEYIEWKAAITSADGTGTGILPDSYAPPDSTGTPYITRSQVALADDIALAGQEPESTTHR